MNLSLGQRLLLITAAGLMPVLGVLAYNEVRLRQTRHIEIKDLALSTAQQAALEMERLTSGVEGTLRAISSAPAVASLERGRCEPYLSRLKDRMPEFTAISVFDLEGNARCRSDRALSALNFSDRAYFQAALARPGQMTVSEYTTSRITGIASLPLAMAIVDDAGRTVGVVASGLDLGWLGRTLGDRNFTKNASLTMADRKGTIIAREPLPERFVGTKIPETFRHLVSAPEPGAVELSSQDGTRRILGYIPAQVSRSGIYVSAGISVDEAFAAIEAGTRRAALLVLFSVVAAVALAWSLGTKLVNGPVRLIQKVLANRRAGDEEARTGMLPESGELEAIGAELDRYMDELNERRTEREKAEEHRRLLTEEMSHRMKNMLATIQAIAMQTLRKETPPEVLKAFMARLHSVAGAQKLLTGEGADAASLRDAIMTSVGLFENSPGERFTLDGPDLRLNSGATLSIAMAFHELCTNALKYGALSAESGRVDIVWDVKSQRELEVVWTERDGPAVMPPKNTGFGSTMLQKLLSNNVAGEVTLNYLPEGLKFQLAAPLEAVTG